MATPLLSKSASKYDKTIYLSFLFLYVTTYQNGVKWRQKNVTFIDGIGALF